LGPSGKHAAAKQEPLVTLDAFVTEPGLTLLDLLDADVSGRDLPRDMPDPMIFPVATEELGATPARCFVVEDAARSLDEVSRPALAEGGLEGKTLERKVEA